MFYKKENTMKTEKQFTIRAHRELAKSYPNLTEAKRTIIIDRYISAVVNEINSKINQFTRDKNYIVSAKKIANNTWCSPEPNKQQRMDKWFRDHCPIYSVISLGTNLSYKNEFTEIKMNYEHKIAIDVYYMALTNGETLNTREIYEEIYGDLFAVLETEDDNLVDVTPVDLKSLQAYISKTVEYAKTKDTLESRIRKAKQIYILASVSDGMLYQVKSESAYGRHFYKGPNLQNAHKD